ncbi:hypothetical protein TKK_0018174 [Trichogramma kaykai]
MAAVILIAKIFSRARGSPLGRGFALCPGVRGSTTPVQTLNTCTPKSPFKARGQDQKTRPVNKRKKKNLK